MGRSTPLFDTKSLKMASCHWGKGTQFTLTSASGYSATSSASASQGGHTSHVMVSSGISAGSSAIASVGSSAIASVGSSALGSVASTAGVAPWPQAPSIIVTKTAKAICFQSRGNLVILMISFGYQARIALFGFETGNRLFGSSQI